MSRWLVLSLLLIGWAAAFAGPAAPSAPEPTAMPSPSPSPTLAPSVLATPSPAATPVPTPEPTPNEPKSRCNDLATMKSRMACRVQLKTYDGYYEPEECRVIQDSAKHSRCQAVYRSIQECRHLSTDAARDACVAEKVGLKKTVAEEKVACKQAADPLACRASLKTKVNWVAKFRFYNLEEKAERFLKFGLPQDDVVSLEVYLESQKQAFNAATTFEQQKTILLDVKARWAAFVSASLKKLNEERA